MDSREELQKSYIAKCAKVATLLAADDPIQIATGNPDPVEEYLGEASEIVRRLLGAGVDVVDRECASRILTEVFADEFDVVVDEASVDQLVTQILIVINA